MKLPGYIALLDGRGESILHPDKVENVRLVGHCDEVGTGRTLVVYEYDYRYPFGRLTHRAYVPEGRQYGFEHEVARAHAERARPAFVDPLKSMTTASG